VSFFFLGRQRTGSSKLTGQFRLTTAIGDCKSYRIFLPYVTAHLMIIMEQTGAYSDSFNLL